MSFFRLLRGELNKILMRPILYVITGLLVVALTFSYFLYNPSERTDGSVTDYDNCENLNEIYNTFISGTTSHGKTTTEQYISNAVSAINNAESNNTSDILDTFANYITDINEKFEIYRSFNEPTLEASIENNIAPASEITAYENFKSAFLTLKTTYESYINSTNSPLLLKTETNNSLNQLFVSTQTLINSITTTQHDSHKTLRSTLIENDSINKIETLIDTITIKTVPEAKLAELEGYITTAETYLTTLETEIVAIKDGGDVEQMAELKTLAIRYYLVGFNVNELINMVTKYTPVLSMSDSAITTYYGYAGIYSYQINEEITYRTYLVTNDAVSTDFASVYSPTRTSNSEVNAFDFVYFGLEITSFIIIIFTVVIAAGMLAGEQSNGTLKLLLIRPYSRNKILTSKLLATLIFATIFLLFSTIVLFLIGLFTMGANFTPILCIFNSTNAFVASPAFVLFVYLLCLIFKVLIYVLIALAISAIFRSNVAAVGISIVIYFLLSLFGTIFAGSYWYGFLPFSNFDLFKYFGGAFVASGNNTPLSIIFSSHMFYGGNSAYGILITLGIGAILAVCTYWIFKKREIK